MNQLYFRYSEVYEYMLSSACGETLSEEKINIGYDFVNKYIEHWNKYNDVIFNYYKEIGFVVPDFWIAYFIHPRKGITPFSDPLTLFIKEDLDEVTATLVHELAHVILSYGPNFELEQKLWNHIQKTYPENSFGTNIELMTIIVAKEALKKIFDKDKAEKYFSLEKSYSSLRRAWEIIDSQNEASYESDPIKEILNLK